MLVIPIFFPMIPFIACCIYTPLGYTGQWGNDDPIFNPSLPLTFSFVPDLPGGSTNGKQTSKGLFIFHIPMWGFEFRSALLLASLAGRIGR